MVTPIRINQETTLTGNTRVRIQRWTGKVVLQVEVNLDTIIGLSRESNTGTRWRDANASDVGLDFKSLTPPT